MKQTPRDGLLLIVIASAGYAMFPIFTKTLLDTKQFEPLDILILRFLLATPITWLVMFFRNRTVSNVGEGLRPSPTKPLPRIRLLGMGVIFVMTSASAFFTLQRLPASTYTVILYSYPAMVAIISWLLGERLAGRAWLALALTLAGIILTVPDFGGGLGDLTGLLLGLSNAGFYAAYIVLSGRLLKGHTDLAGASAWSITGSFLLLVSLALVRGVAWPADLATWARLFGLAIFSTVIPIFAFYAGMQKLGAARAAILSTIEPLFTLGLAYLLLNERIEPVQLFGGALILVSVILLQTGRGEPENTLAAEPQVSTSP
jgi:drug/metabolite transporter (DMT)-like permease